MIELLQDSTNLIGSSKAIKELMNKDHARILTISDSHSNSKTFINLIKHFGPDCDALVFCGDGARDLYEILNYANANVELKKSIPPVIAFVRGNGDPETIPVNFKIQKNNILQSNIVNIPVSQVLCVNGQKFFISHGHYQGVDFGYENLGLAANLSGAKYAIHGHTHVPVWLPNESCSFINPGSISRPRGGSPNSLAIITVEKSFIDVAFIKITNPASEEASYTVYTPMFIM